MMSPESYIGSIGEFASTWTPQGWLDCDGRLMNIAQNAALYSLLGTIYGGDGTTTFALPDLRPWANDGQPDTGHRRRVDWRELKQPRQCICVAGVYPSRP
jgi:microcystin-dependent protein